MSNQSTTQRPGLWLWFLLTTIALVAVGIGCGNREDTSTDKDKDKNLPPDQKLYHTHCARCHGNEGKADNSYARGLNLRPFTARPWKGDVTKDHIRKITVDGIQGTAMPALKTLNDADLNMLVDYVYKLSTDGKGKES